MTQQFTANEVRDSAVAVAARDMQYEAKMLRAYAERLEADEKAVPVAWLRESGVDIESEGGCITNAVRNLWLASNPKRVERYTIPLFTHPSPAYEERLAEALRGILEIGKRNMENQKYDGFFNAAREVLAAHSTQAQPPAASVPDTLAVFEVVSGVEGPCLTISREADGKPRHEYRLAGPKPWGGGTTTHSFKVHTRELREQIDAIEAALAAQENPNA